MPYLTPLWNSADIPLGDDQYIQPPASAVNFDFATQASLIQFSRVPGVIVSWQAPWAPQPGAQDADAAAPFQQARLADVDRAINSDQASTILDPTRSLAYSRPAWRDLYRATPWALAVPFSRDLRSPYSMPAIKDLDRMAGPWEAASIILDDYRSSPFAALTPYKDNQVRSWFYSSDVYGPLWRREENLPAPLGLVSQGVANLELTDGGKRTIYRVTVLELGHPFAPHPSQPKDDSLVFPAGVANVVDRRKRIPWGPAGARDTTLDFNYDDYPGPIDTPNLFTIPTYRIYVVANSAQIVRVSDGMDVPAQAVTLSTSADQFTWGMSATLASKAAKALVEGQEGEPVEVDVTINGITWRILVDAWDTNEAWGKDQVRITGRSRAAYLAAPYAGGRDYIETSGLLAQQLAAQELPPGWTLEWNAVDWFIQAGAWQYQGLTPISAITRIAQAAAGYVQADPALDKLVVNTLYPAQPWELESLAPDYQIPHAVMLQRSSRKQPGQIANGVFVSGGTVDPYHGQVIRRQSNGLPLAPQVVNQLVTDRNPAEALGIAALAATGRQATEVYQLPLDAALGGLIEVGSHVEVGSEVGQTFLPEWRGLVRGVNISAAATRAANKGVRLVVRQALTVLRHFEEDP